MNGSVGRETWVFETLDDSLVSDSGFGVVESAFGRYLDKNPATLTPTIGIVSRQEYERFALPLRSALVYKNNLGNISTVATQAPKTQARQASFEALKEWEGYVTSIDDRSFSARMVDLSSRHQRETDEGTFSIDEVSDGDRALLRNGAVFRWSVGYQKSPSGVRRKVSSIVFRRLPTWSKRGLADSRRRAEALLDSIQWEGNPLAGAAR